MEEHTSNHTPDVATAEQLMSPGDSKTQPQVPDDAPPKNAAASGAAITAKPQLSGRSLVTATACTRCRAKRAKCDGLQPCSRCATQTDVECVYETSVRQSKDSLRMEIERLRQRQHSNDRVFAALVQPQLLTQVLARLNMGHSADIISKWLGDDTLSGPNDLPIPRQDISTNGQAPLSDSLSDVAELGARSIDGIGGDMANSTQLPNAGDSVDQSSQQHITPRDQMSGIPFGRMDDLKYQTTDQFLVPLNISEDDIPPSTWTDITTDKKLIRHLLALYFCWEYPTFASLSKEHFLKDFETGSHRYCSPILVNALLALGCRFSTQLNDPANPNAPYNSGQRFFSEALRLFELQKNRHSLTTIQALGVMSIREASCGRAAESWDYTCQSMQLAVEMGLHQAKGEGDQDQNVVEAATFWGAFAIDQAWSLSTGTLPRCSNFPNLPLKPPFFDNVEASLWIPYTGDGSQRSYKQQSNVRSVYSCSCELSELVHWSLGILYAPSQTLTSQDILVVYARYLNWYDSIPDVLKLGHNFTPAGFFVHLYYHFRILLLFRPLIKFRILWSSVLPRDVCSQAANAIQGLLHSYAQLHTLKRTPFFVPYIAFTSSLMHFTNWTSAQRVSLQSSASSAPFIGSAIRLNPEVIEAITQGIRDQTEMAPYNGLAAKALDILQDLGRTWDIDMVTDHGEYQQGFEPLTISKTKSLSFYTSNASPEDLTWTGSANTALGSSQTGSWAELQSPERASALSDISLFLSAPMHRYPIALTGKELEEAGFDFL